MPYPVESKHSIPATPVTVAGCVRVCVRACVHVCGVRVLVPNTAKCDITLGSEVLGNNFNFWDG